MKIPHLVRKKHDERLVLHRLQETDHVAEFREAVRVGLGRSPKQISPKFFYDERGSQLFEAITRTEEYYPTRTEAALLTAHVEEIIDTAGEHMRLVELGSGSSTKTRVILDAIAARQKALEYIPIDISPTIVTEFGKQLLEDYPDLTIRGLICDYRHAMAELRQRDLPNKLFLFLGSSMGNFLPEDAVSLLRDIRATMNAHDYLLLGLDMVKEAQVLHRAYNDAAGVTAEFNLNLLARINRELGGEFNLAGFRHRAFYDAAQRRIEMHLESLANQIVPIAALGRSCSFKQGETIHTENSYKFDRHALDELFSGAGLRLTGQWFDPRRWFSLNLLAQA
ncbi:MAG: L-histidine N(alpha)-methyltransferase [Candidatus Lambdaproteobacteria bacterium]|nr:L-histidine N(alpha)-methyltransferase [Candidatus Lambdaproteobacteria bacterium]